MTVFSFKGFSTKLRILSGRNLQVFCAACLACTYLYINHEVALQSLFEENLIHRA